MGFPNINRGTRPKLADVQCSRMEFKPGDRLLVKVYASLDRDQKQKLLRAVQKWAGRDVEVFIIDARMMEMQVERPAIIKH